MTSEKVQPSQGLNPKVIERIVDKCIRAFHTRPKANQQEILLALANLIYSIGASIDGYKEKGPPIEELKRMYYTNPTIGTNLMLQSALLSLMVDNIRQGKIKEKVKEDQ